MCQNKTKLRKLKPKHSKNWHLDKFKADIERMIIICANRGYLLTPSDAAWAWEQYSDGLAAGWLGLHSDDQIVFDCLMMYLEPEKDVVPQE